MNNNNQKAMDKVQYDVNVAKSRLIDVMYKLEEAGEVRKAKSLSTIIGMLEHWQHTK